GIRVWVDGDLIIDQWYEHAVQTFTGEKYLNTGHHLVRVEYFERSGTAVAKLTWGRKDASGGSGGTWRAEYFNNTSLSGTPAFVRDESAINYSWVASPAPGVNADNFSVRWSRNLNLPAGNYRFTMVTDDGARLFISGRTLIDAWFDQAPTTYTGEIVLPGGPVTVQMEYYERGGGATAQLGWQRLDDGGGTPITEWQGEYFNNRNLSGPPALVRNDPQVNFEWGGGSPQPGRIDVDNFSARWTRTWSLPADTYRFIVTVDDGVRLYINGRLLIESWREQAPTTYSTEVYLPGGPVQIEMQYFEASGGATAILRWEPATSPPPIPTPTPRPPSSAVIVDNTDPGFVNGGDPRSWRTEREGYGGTLLWTRNNDRANYNYNWGRWYPNLAAGRYEVFVYIPDRYTTTDNARYWISHQGGLTLRVVNQSANGDRWVSLGTYQFRGTEQDYVSLADVTFEYRLSRLIAWDAMKWEPR
ncbi:MAG: hypothetical protein KDE19_13130, partial [Caldilineaceae bacterium]|nr:hypothetical protein [Caldilineaceae bacterium]